MITCLELHITSFVTWKQQKCALPLKYTGALGKYNQSSLQQKEVADLAGNIPLLSPTSQKRTP